MRRSEDVILVFLGNRMRHAFYQRVRVRVRVREASTKTFTRQGA